MKIIFLSLNIFYLIVIIILYIRMKYFSIMSIRHIAEYEEIKNLYHQIEKQFYKIIYSIPQPSFIIDREGKIIFTNPAIKEITEGELAEGHNYLEFFNQPEFIEAIQKIQNDKENILKEIAIGNRTYLVFFTHLDNERIFVFFKDISDKKEIERIKKELISNMSHELKTPLTAIRGYIETLYDEVPSTLKSHLDIVKKHTERLTSIVNDLLTLSELEETKIYFQDIDIEGIIKKVVDTFDRKIKDKKLNLTLEIDKTNKYLKGDPYKIEEMLINLIDNAVRYTDKGEIRIKTERKDGNLITTIKDTGIGIPEKDLPRIFERFYVVDKTRSKETGGTGLGLAIVKHIVLLHGGNIEVKSSLGYGTEVIVSLPIVQKNP
ncbi:MAG TPA: ATP-binding protein [bacterium]|nr:ATP-binding protein [bacterium]HPP29942.1 ATP-binding protein [bacterium]